MKLLVLCLVMAASFNIGQCQDYCLARDNAPYVFFSTDTAYENVYDKSTSEVVIPNCKPVQFWLLSRHGTRYPDAEGINAMWTLPDLRDSIVKNHEKKERGSLCPDDLKNLKKWTPQVVQTLAEDLAIPQGYNDLYKMAKRFQNRFPSLLNQSYSPDKFEVKFTQKQRTTLTATAFLDGLFGSTTGVYLPEPKKIDPLLRPYKSCDKWQEEVDDNPDTLDEMNKFLEGSYMQNLIKGVSKRLGFKQDLTIDELTAIHDACGFEKAWRVNEVSPWCAAFSKEELQVWEYYNDLKYYYNTGYGTKLNKKMGCPPVKDFLDRFRKIEKGKKQPDGVLYFSHASLLQLVLNPLGIAKDDTKLKHSNFDEMRDRKWRTSFITPFATNLAVVFFKCDKGDAYRVQFYLGEKLLEMKGCTEGLCDWSYIKDKIGNISDECNLDWC